jgi:hypothetical protein
MGRIFAAIIILGIILSISGCTNQASNKTYSENGLTFNYPGNWSQLNTSQFQNSIGTSGTLLVVVGDKDQNRFGIATANIGAGQELKTPAEWANGMNTSSGFQYLSGKSSTIDGVEGYQLSMKDPSNNYNYYYAYWVKNNKGYLSVLVSPIDQQSLFENISKSIKIT